MKPQLMPKMGYQWLPKGHSLHSPSMNCFCYSQKEDAAEDFLNFQMGQTLQGKKERRKK